LEAEQSIPLTGAGFTKNFGGFLGSEMWSLILGQKQINDDPDLRKILLGTLDYEQAYDSVINSGLLSERQKEEFAEAIKNAYQVLHDVVLQRNGSERQVTHNFCQLFIQKFAGQARKAGFIFTVNQDLFLEAFYRNDVAERLKVLGLGHPSWFNGRQQKGVLAPDPVELPNEDRLESIKQDYTRGSQGGYLYVKLHGSIGWRSSTGSRALVIGNNKTTVIQQEPLLKWYSELFREVLNKPSRNLIVIGYGFRDPHINEWIADAIDKSGLRLYVISTLSSRDFRSFISPTKGCFQWDSPVATHGDRIWQGLHGYYSNEIFDFFDRQRCRLTPLGERLFHQLSL
jgi:hypothetical protein